MARQFKVLIVNDNIDDQFLIEEAFQTTDMQCSLEFAPDGKKALQFLENAITSLPDLIVLDLNMPVMNGFEVLSCLRTSELSPRIPVVV